jgi:S-sulfo-L-cysteine synthase (O-acetyl-L-serine-dependent)
MTPSPILARLPLAADLTARIGHTPLVPVGGLPGVPESVTVLGKAEWLNPGGSVKDRAAWGIVQAAEADGALGRGRILLDATSGNTGIAYAWIGAARGFRVTLCVPANASAERRRLLAALGAELVLTDAMDGTDGAIREARRLAAGHPERYFYADQYANPANWRAHYLGTAEEVWEQSEGRVTHLVAGIGTSGTLVGTSRRLRVLNPSLTAVAVQPDSPLHALEGLKHLPSAMTPPIYDSSAHQRTIEVGSEEAIAMVKRQARRGLLLGWSAGAALVAAERLARELAHGVVVAILPDGAERYLGEPSWGEDA